MDDSRIPRYSSPHDVNGLTPPDYRPTTMVTSNHQEMNHNLFQPHRQSGTFSHFDSRAPQANSFGTGMQLSAANAPAVNVSTGNLDFHTTSQRNSFNNVSAEGRPTRFMEGHLGRSTDFSDGFNFPGPSHEITEGAPWQTVSHNFDDYGRLLSAKNPQQNEMGRKLNPYGTRYRFPQSNSMDGSLEFSLTGKSSDPSRAWQEQSTHAQNQALRGTDLPIHSEQLFTNSSQVPEPTFDRNYYSQLQFFEPMTHSSENDDYLCPQPPVSTAVRNIYIDDLAATKAPHSRKDLLQAKDLSQRRMNEPNFFQFPESPPKQVKTLNFLSLRRNCKEFL